MRDSISFSAKTSVAATALRNAFSSIKPQLSLLTDFGTGDEAVYAVKSAAMSVNPRIVVEDICHNVPLGNILLGAWRLQRVVTLQTERPGTAYVAVVDPGVGSDRKNVIVKTGGSYLIGPDNGVLSLAFSSRGVEAVVEIEKRSLTLLHNAQSRTFHGKDVFAPAAAHILRGVPIEEFGRSLDPADLARISISAKSTESSRAGFLVDVDGFGSIRTNVPNHVPVDAVGREIGFKLKGPSQEYQGKARVVRTFAEAKEGETVFVLSSTGCLDLAVNLGSASERFDIAPNQIRVDSELKPQSRIELDLS